MTTIYLVRHGEVAGNAGHKQAFVGWGDLPLNEIGKQQAVATGGYFAKLQDENIKAIYSSDLQRAHDTAKEIAANVGLEVQTHVDLREVNYGLWEGLGEAELLADHREHWLSRQDDPWNIAPPEGESYAQMWARFLPQWEAMLASHDRHDDEAIIFVGHNGLIRMLVCHLLGAPFSNFKRVHVSNCGISQVEVGAGKTLIRYINDTGHLASNN